MFSLFLGAACLAAEFYLFPVNADDPLDSDNVGELLCLAGCVFVAAGVIWGVVNLIRLMLWRKPVEVVPVPVPPAELTSQL